MAIGGWHLPILTGGGDCDINYTVDVFTASGTYTKPANLNYAIVLMVSGGAGGFSGRRGAASSNRGGGGGGLGAIILSRFTNSELDATETVTVGTGGTGGAAITTNDTNGVAGTAAGGTEFKFGIFFRVGEGVNGGGTASVINAALFMPLIDISSARQNVLSVFGCRHALGASAVSNQHRGNSNTTIADQFTPQNATSVGGQIRSTNVQVNAGRLAGFYNDSNVLTGEMAGTLPETAAVQPTEFYTFGQFLKRFFPWFDPADANYNVGRGGLGGGCGDTAGTIAGFAGANGVGYGAAGGGGGASTNGANSGAGGNGTDGIVIIVNVLNS